MKLKKIGRALLYPHIAVLLGLLPIATVFLIYSLIHFDSESVIACCSYALAAYTLTVGCFRIPRLVRFLQLLWHENVHMKRWQEDLRLRVHGSLCGGLVWNSVYAVFQLGLGIRHHTFWYCSLAGYYASLAIMRFFLVRHTSRYESGENMKRELQNYRLCGVAFFFMNWALALMIFFMVYRGRTFHHHEITTIAMAAYTFLSLTLAIVNIVKYRKYNSPVYSASKAIGLASALVSMLILESTMLTTFSDSSMTLSDRQMMLGISGAVLSAFIIGMAIYMIVRSTKQINQTDSRGIE